VATMQEPWVQHLDAASADDNDTSAAVHLDGCVESARQTPDNVDLCRNISYEMSDACNY